MDGLPSETNTNEKEPDFAKNRKSDHLVPTLFFFQDKDDYDTFAAQVKNVATRDVKFQKLFAKYAKGTFPLSKFAMDVNVSNCVKRIKTLLGKENVDSFRLPVNEIKAAGDVSDLTILMCNDREIHKFACNDKFSRNKWVKKVNKLVDRRAKRLKEINSGLLGVVTGHNGQQRPSVMNGSPLVDPMTPDMRASIIGDTNGFPSIGAIGVGNGGAVGIGRTVGGNKHANYSRASMHKLSTIKAVEADFD